MSRKSFWILFAIVFLLVATGGALFVRAKFKDRKTFLDTLLPDALTLQKETGIDPVITLTQALHESGNTGSLLARQYNNLYGIKAGTSWRKAGKSYVLMSTHEEVATGTQIQVGDYFRTYPSFLASMRDWAEVLRTLFPQAYFAATSGDVPGFAEGLKHGVYGAYATQSDYAANIIALAPIVKTTEGLA